MIIGVVISALYALVVVACLIGFLKFQSLPRCCSVNASMPVYVVVSFHNEESSVGPLVNSLLCQTYKYFKVVLIDDGSTDSTYSELVNASNGFSQFSVVTRNNGGKDSAIRDLLDGLLGIDIQRGLILVTDADCNPPVTWVETVVSVAERSGASMLIGPVCIDTRYPLQATEFLSIQGVTIGSANISHPIVCGGANLAFTAEAYRRVSNFIPSGISSGGDMFLLEAMKRAGESVKAVNSAGALVVTRGKESLKEFMAQRGRWSGKSTKYSDVEIILTATIVVLMQLLLIASIVISFRCTEALLFWLVKFFIDLPLLITVALKYKTPELIPYIPLVSIIYPFYVIAVLVNNLCKRFS